MTFPRTTRLRWRRISKRRRKQVENMRTEASQNLDRHFVRRLSRLASVRRFVLGWTALLFLVVLAMVLQILMLAPAYKVKVAAPGGTYTEGIVGSFTNANPLYAAGSVDSSVSRLLFASLLKYDEDHRLVGDLAEKWSLDASEKIYTIKLRPNLSWHDGRPLTARDVVFTYHTIQNPDARSYLQASWRGIDVQAKDGRTVVFTLPSQLSAFPNSLTNGIVPEHILGDLAPGQLRSHDFNTVQAIGAGPFRLEALEVKGNTADSREENISLTSFERYHAGPPQLNRFVIRAFRGEKQLLESYRQHQLDAMVGLLTVPSEIRNDDSTQQFGIPAMGQVMVFFKTSAGPLKDAAVRKALVLGANRPKALAAIPYAVSPSTGPLLGAHIGYDPKLIQATNNTSQARAALDMAGWTVDPATGLRAKAGQTLTFRLYAQNDNEYRRVVTALQQQWQAIGVRVDVKLQAEEDLKTTVSTRSYDALLDAISLGPDPDVYAYWHSTQADPRSPTRLNFSEYRVPAADQALEAGRTRSDPTIRAAKYKPFLETWQNDFPALALYQPRFLYMARSSLHGFDPHSVIVAPDRYARVERWTIREAQVKYAPDLKNRL